MTGNTTDFAAHYADAIEVEKKAWEALQAQRPGTRERADAWANWSEAIHRTNRAWRQLSCRTLTQPADRTAGQANTQAHHGG